MLYTQLIGAKLLCVWWYFVSGCQSEKAAKVPFHLEFHWAYQALTTFGAWGHARHVLTMSYKFLESKEVKRVPHIEVTYPLLPNPPGPLLMSSPPNFIDFFWFVPFFLCSICNSYMYLDVQHNSSEHGQLIKSHTMGKKLFSFSHQRSTTN